MRNPDHREQFLILLARPHERKRKRYTLVECEPPVGHDNHPPRKKAIADAQGDHVNSNQIETHGEPQTATTPRETTEYVQAALIAQFGGTNHHPFASSPAAIVSPASTCVPGSSPSVGSLGFLGRSKYLGGELLGDEDAVPDENAQLPHSTLTEDDLKVLEIRKAFELPPRAACESLIATFVAKCDPWMPVVSRRTLTALQNGRMSETPIVLLQALLMAGS